MNKYLQDLIKLSKFDTAISMFEPKIENEKAKLATFVETASTGFPLVQLKRFTIEDEPVTRTSINCGVKPLGIVQRPVNRWKS